MARHVRYVVNQYRPGRDQLLVYFVKISSMQRIKFL
jgi:hypothetical protein